MGTISTRAELRAATSPGWGALAARRRMPRPRKVLGLPVRRARRSPRGVARAEGVRAHPRTTTPARARIRGGDSRHARVAQGAARRPGSEARALVSAAGSRSSFVVRRTLSRTRSLLALLAGERGGRLEDQRVAPTRGGAVAPGSNHVPRAKADLSNVPACDRRTGDRPAAGEERPGSPVRFLHAPNPRVKGRARALEGSRCRGVEEHARRGDASGLDSEPEVGARRCEPAAGDRERSAVEASVGPLRERRLSTCPFDRTPCRSYER